MRSSTLPFVVFNLLLLVSAHGSEHPADSDSEATYAELHMASEHHMDSFDIQAFFHLHDLNRDGILDVNELESIYGVHHEKVKSSSGSAEVHTEKAREIVAEVLAKLDENGDGVLTMREFVKGGVGGLPNFKGVEHLGHHYDAEGEYFLHHEEQFHNTPETQREEDYTHPEDIEHFLKHQQIEDEEDVKVLEFQGLDPHGRPLPLLSGQQQVSNSADSVPLDSSQLVLNDEEIRQARSRAAKVQADKFSTEARDRGEWGSDGFRVRDEVDRVRKSVPYKFRMKGSSGGFNRHEKDPKWSKFSQSVEKCLVAFEGVNEWADFITFLAKLLKCLQSYPTFQVIPHKLTVAKRLSQCLNPALPTGVHQRALDVYTHILTAIGPDNLRRDLPAWSSGLFPFFQYAATSVKPIILGIYERFYLPLQEALRPATKAFILALLPGLEEETGEFFEKVAELLDRVSGTVSPAFFFQNVWLVLITAPNSRIPALNYLSRRLPKMQSEDRVSSIVGQDVGLMVRGFAAALDDPQILVQRGVLDLLTSTLKLDSVGFKSTRRDDQILLMRALSGVVLRKDLSLSRRLYSWLLGPSESSEMQIAYLKEHGLELLRVALKMEMDSHTADTPDRHRPFKIFISLLDKWEIGGCLTEVLVLDSFSALRASLRPGDDHDELLMTGNMLFEIVDPFLMWRQIFTSMRDALSSEGSIEAIHLARFIIQTFRLHDEEVQRLHAPYVTFGILDLAESTSRDDLPAKTTDKLTAALSFTRDLLQEISPKFFETVDSAHESPPEHLGFNLASSLYEATDMKTASITETEGRELLASAFVSALRLAKTSADALVSEDEQESHDGITTLLSTILSVISALSAATSHSSDTMRAAWKPEEWVESFVRCLESSKATPTNFSHHSGIIRVILTLVRTPALRPSLKRNQRILVEALTAKLLDYLQPACAPCFLQSVRLLWGVQELSDCRHVETMIAARIASSDATIRLPAIEAFGNLWRFTEDGQLPGLILRTPMFMMLDSLKSDDLSTRRAGEAWMRCSLKSYLRILDPLLFGLLDPAIKRKKRTIDTNGIGVPILVYEQPFDQAKIHHILDDLLSLARFGGQGFIRIAKGSFLKHSLDPAFRERVRASDLETQTYLDGLIVVLVEFLRSESTPELIPSLAPLNYHIHSVCAELLQVILSRGEAEILGLPTIESTLTSRLYLCIHRSELDLQNKLLHVLHSVVHALLGTHRKQSRGDQRNGDLKNFPAKPNEAQPANMAHDTMFVRVVADAVTLQQNNAVIHHWIDFLLMTIPQYRQSLASVIFPLIDCLVRRLRLIIQQFHQTYSTNGQANSQATDAEYTVLMNALERLVLIAIMESGSAIVEEDLKVSEKGGSEGSTSVGAGLLGYVTGVLVGSDIEPLVANERPKTKALALGRLRESINLLLYSWEVTSVLEAAADGDQNNSQGYFTSRIRLRARKALERLYKAAPAGVLDCIVSFWDKDRSTSVSGSAARLFEMLDFLAPSALKIVSMLTEKLISRGSGFPDRQRPQTSPSDDISFQFYEAYLERMEGPIAVQVWSLCLSFFREFLSNLSTSRPYIFSCLKCFTTLSEKISQTSALEDRRMRRDLQDTFIRLVDASTQLAGRAADQGGWLRRTMVDGGLAGDNESIISDKGKGEDDYADEEKRAPLPVSQSLEITQYLARRALPDFRRFLIDTDKTVAACTNMVYYIVSPALKTRAKSFEIETAVFELLTQMAQQPANIKAWRTQVAEMFADNRFFNSPPSSHAKWKPLIQALMASDKERVVELIAKVTTVSSANIFTNRELESLSRALSLRRLTYTIFTGEKNRFLTQLPIIQEKLVDLLRSSVGDTVHAEVYLCLRVLFCRIGYQHLSGLWPVILTELLRLYESLVDHAVPEGSDLLQLVLSASKFLDLTLVLQTEDFQIHEWMFVTDTVDAIYPPDLWLPQAIMDRLGDILADPHATPPASATYFPSTPPSPTPAFDQSGGRKPRLTLRRIGTIGALEPFFSSISLSAYESVYNSGGKIDWGAVESVLERDIFDGES